MQGLAHRVALVTGAASGTGAAIAAALCDAGARVLVSDIDAIAGRATAARLGAEWLQLDVRQELAWIAAMARLLDSHGRLDVLVNSVVGGGLDAGLAPDPEHTSLADWRALHHGTLDGLFLGCKHGLRAMRRSGGGTILNRASASSSLAVRAALRAHTRLVARYGAELGLAVQCHRLRPGPRDAVVTQVLRLAGA